MFWVHLTETSLLHVANEAKPARQQSNPCICAGSVVMGKFRAALRRNWVGHKDLKITRKVPRLIR